jgi:hypothetical protein
VICEVSDSSSTAPHLRRARAFDEGGRGLLLVAQLTQGWGTRHTPHCKTIWCAQPLPSPDQDDETDKHFASSHDGVGDPTPSRRVVAVTHRFTWSQT